METLLDFITSMREATTEEKASVDKYIKSISRETTENFFDKLTK